MSMMEPQKSLLQELASLKKQTFDPNSRINLSNISDVCAKSVEK